MTPLRLKLVLAMSIALSLMIAGCTNKKPVTVQPTAPPTPPVAEATPTPTPAPQQPAQTEQTQPQPQGETPKQEQAAPTPANSTKAKPSPRKRIVDENKTEAQTTPGQISPGLSKTDAQRDQAATEQLLQNTENAVGGIKRQLTEHEQAMLAQIRDFITQSRKAIAENDLVKARNFAVKAHLLSDALVQQR